MKRIILLTGLILFGSFSSEAAAFKKVTQDPTVNAIRKNFIDSKAPTEADLKPGQDWDCKNFMVQKGNYDVYEVRKQLHFEIINAVIQNTGSSPVKKLDYKSKGIVGLNPEVNDGTILELRKNSDGNLVAEYSMPKASLKKYNKNSRDVFVIQALHNPKYVALIYKVCTSK